MATESGSDADRISAYAGAVLVRLAQSQSWKTVRFR
jgi:hypothetical protein